MNPLMITGATHQVYAKFLQAAGRRAATEQPSDRDGGAVSLEQVLWYVAAGVSVAVIAAILWNQIRDQAQTDVEVPVAPTP